MRTPASARMCAESQICTAFVLIGTKPTLVQNGGSVRVLRTWTAWLSQLQSGRRGCIQRPY